jgi:hypothetical protein
VVEAAVAAMAAPSVVEVAAAEAIAVRGVAARRSRGLAADPPCQLAETTIAVMAAVVARYDRAMSGAVEANSSLEDPIR